MPKIRDNTEWVDDAKPPLAANGSRSSDLGHPVKCEEDNSCLQGEERQETAASATVVASVMPAVCPTPDHDIVSLDSDSFGLDGRFAPAMIANTNRMIGKVESLKKDFMGHKRELCEWRESMITSTVVSAEKLKDTTAVLEDLLASMWSSMSNIIDTRMADIEDRLLPAETLHSPMDTEVSIDTEISGTSTAVPVTFGSSSALPATSSLTTIDCTHWVPPAVAGMSRPALEMDLPAEEQCSSVMKRGKKKYTAAFPASIGAKPAVRRKYSRMTARNLDEEFARKFAIIKWWWSAPRLDISVNELADHMQDSLSCDTAMPRASRSSKLTSLSSKIEVLSMASRTARRALARCGRRRVVDAVRELELRDANNETGKGTFNW